MAIASLRNLSVRALHICRSLAALVLVGSGLFLLFHLFRRPGILVVAYHHVTPDAEMARSAYPHRHVSTTSFDKQLRALKRLYRLVSVTELRQILEGRRRLRRHVAVVTFDDGYRDNFENAFPILRRHAAPAAFFLSLGFVGEGRGFWFDRLADGLRAWDRHPALRNELRPLMPGPLVSAFDAPLQEGERLRRAVSFFATLPLEERRAVLKRLTPALVPAPGRTSARPLRWPEIREMLHHGMEFGAHGVTHRALARMPESEARSEIEASLADVAARLGKEITTFAYPYGHADSEVARLAREAGVQLGFTLGGAVNRRGSDPLLLARRSLCEASSRSAFAGFSQAYFWCEIAGVFDWFHRRGRHRPQPGAASLLDWSGPRECTRLPRQAVPAAGRAASRVLLGLEASARLQAEGESDTAPASPGGAGAR